MSHGRMIRTGVVVEESKDAGPHKMIKVTADGKQMDVKVLDFAGLSGSPLKDSEVLLLIPDDDDGRAYAIPLGPPTKDRVDGQKPGEVDVRNHKSGSSTKYKDGGNVETHATADAIIKSDGKVYIN